MLVPQENWARKSDATISERLLEALAQTHYGMYGEELPVIFAEIKRRYPDLAKRQAVFADTLAKAAQTLEIYVSPEHKLTPLLDLGMGVETRSEEGYTPLLNAANVMRRDSIQLLLDHGANIDATSMYGENVLHMVARQAGFGDKSKELAVKMLLEKGANPAQADRNGMTPLAVFAAQQSDIRIFRAFANVTPEIVNLAATDNKTPLWFAAWHVQLKTMDWLIGKGADVNLPTKQGWSLLETAAANGRTRVMRTLLAAGADITYVNALGGSVQGVKDKKAQTLLADYLHTQTDDFAEGMTQVDALAPMLDKAHPAFAETQQRVLLWCGAGLLPELFAPERWRGKEAGALALYGALHAAMPAYWQNKMDATVERSEWRKTVLAEESVDRPVAWAARRREEMLQKKERVR